MKSEIRNSKSETNPKSKIEKFLPGVKRDVLLKNYTTFRIGGPAKYFFEAKTKESFIKAIKSAIKFNLPFFILGGGSNLLVSDKGYNGLVINFQFSSANFQKNKIIVSAGTKLGELVNVSLGKNLSGIEWAAGIPGTVGGAIYGNAGAFGESMANIVKNVSVLDVKDKNFEIKNFTNKDCEFDYRESVFKRNKNLIIISAEIIFQKGKAEEIKEKIKKYINHRIKSQPRGFPSAGSVFKNPSFAPPSPKASDGRSKATAGRQKSIRRLADKNQKLLKEFSEIKEFNKKGQIPVAWLIEKCGLKGKKIGNAQISELHSNFIVNLGGASSEDVLKLIDLIKTKVKSKFKIQIKEEIAFLNKNLN